MLFFKNNTNETVIMDYWIGCLMDDIHVVPGNTININDSSCREWIVLSENYQRIGKFWEKPAVGGITKIIECSRFDLILNGDVWSLEFSR